MIKLRPVYEQVELSDGFRVLVDRLWPRDLSKEEVHIDEWMRDIAPSTELRKWFEHDPEKWPNFTCATELSSKVRRRRSRSSWLTQGDVASPSFMPQENGAITM